jgi:hypothetical protein
VVAGGEARKAHVGGGDDVVHGSNCPDL